MTLERSEITHPKSASGAVSFLVRIWWETREDPLDPPVWRGRIEHVPSGRVAYFDSLTGWLTFVERWTGALVPRQASRKGEEK